MKEIRLPDSLAVGLASGHPWVYRDHVGDVNEKTGSWVRVRAASFSAYGLWDAESAIAVRIFSTEGVPDEAWLRARVADAWALREPVRRAGVTGYRLLFGEADQLPGIVVDLYDRVAVMVTYSKALGALLPAIARAVQDIAGATSVVRRTKDDDGVRLTLLCGEPPPDTVVIHEGAMKLQAELLAGQKTGLFFDHRDNRRYVGERAAGARVLNLFSYTGGFSVAAALGGAQHVVSVDSAAPAIAACARNFELNGLDLSLHTGLAVDAFDWLERAAGQGQRFDLVVCDPPSFAKSRDQLRQAERAYTRLLTLALKVTEPGGMLCAASCTSQVGPALFRRLLVDAARKARVRFQIVRDIGQPDDHPVLVAHEEGRYLKFVAGRVLPRV
ncbi:MAG TPA: class I SAM-dependent rRNA methyltransferase [Polyangiaceae bacterium]|nr:class I SAM-dependent rRNA methyltransferase [Polyangiaceae bacterium]